MATNPKPAVAALGTVTLAAAKDLRLADDNPRKISDRAVDVVALSLQRFGWQQPLVIDGDNAVIAGHTRLLAARKLGLTDVPVVTASGLTEQEVEAYRIADNRTHDFTTWDLPLLVEQLDALAPDFADVLALADWETIVADFENMQNETDLELPDDVDNTLDRSFEVTVCFNSKKEALAAEQTLIDLPGATDVRHKL
ncbi:MAG: ParB N-terminal domain-containing protein [Pseudonocardia sp.]|nr:ParB N-terminal domain-containing protein [Pseudonocardia sp.]